MDGNILTENMNVVHALTPLLRAMNVSTDVINISLQHCATFIIQKGAVAAGTATITIEACDDVVPNNTTAIPFQYRRMVGGTNTWGALTVATAAGFVSIANADDEYEISVDVAEVTNAIVNAARGNQYVRLTMAQVDATQVNIGIICILPRQRYKQQVPISAIV